MGDVLEVPLVGALVEVDGDDRVRIQVVAGADRAVEVRRRIARNEEHGAGFLVDGGRHPHAASQRLVERAVLRKRRFFRRDVAMHVAAGGVVRIPDAFVTLFGNREERPEELAVVRVERLDEAADAVFAAIRADQHLALDDRRRHRFRVTLFRIGDLRFPKQIPGLGVERNELGVDRAHVQLAAFDGDTAIVVAAAHGDDRSQLVLVVPVLFAGRRVDRVHVIERRCQEHDAVDHDRRGLHRFEHGGLEHVGRLHLRHVAGVDLAAGVVSRLIVAAVRMNPVLGVGSGAVEHRLRDRRRRLGHGFCRRGRGARYFLRARRSAPDDARRRDGDDACPTVTVLHRSSVLSDLSFDEVSTDESARSRPDLMQAAL